MWLVPSRLRFQAALVLATLIFGVYGVQELREAAQYGSSYRDGLEALGVAAVFLGIFVAVIWVKRRRARHEEPMRPL